MQRRNFLKDSLAVSAASLVPSSLLPQKKKAEVNNSDSKPFKLNYGIHDGMFKNSVGDSFIEQIKFAHANGFRAIEDNGMMSRSVDQQKSIGDTLGRLGMTMGVFVLTTDNWHWKTRLTTGKQEWLDKMVKDCK